MKPSLAPIQNQQLCTVTLLGNLVAKPEIRYRANPVSAVTDIILATNSKWLDKKSNQYKEWTSYHHIMVAGDLVEKNLINAEKGDIILIQGYLSNLKTNQTKEASSEDYKSIVKANFIQKFKKGYTQSVNQILCSGKLITPPKLSTTLNNKTFSQLNLSINQQYYSADKQSWQFYKVEREIHVWGKQALHLVEHGNIGDDVMVEGKLSYLATADKRQYIEARTIHLLS